MKQNYQISIKRHNYKVVCTDPYEVKTLPTRWEKYVKTESPGLYLDMLMRMLIKCEITAYKIEYAGSEIED